MTHKGLCATAPVYQEFPPGRLTATPHRGTGIGQGSDTLGNPLSLGKYPVRRREAWLVRTTPEQRLEVLAWFRSLSDGYVRFTADGDDIARKIEGPLVSITDAPGLGIVGETEAEGTDQKTKGEHTEGHDGLQKQRV